MIIIRTDWIVNHVDTLQKTLWVSCLMVCISYKELPAGTTDVAVPAIGFLGNGAATKIGKSPCGDGRIVAVILGCVACHKSVLSAVILRNKYCCEIETSAVVINFVGFPQVFSGILCILDRGFHK